MSHCAVLTDCEGPYYCCSSCKNGICKDCLFGTIKNKICDARFEIDKVPCPYCRTNIDLDQCNKKFGEEIIKKLELQSTIYKFCDAADHDYTITEILQISNKMVYKIYPCEGTFEVDYKNSFNLEMLKSLSYELTTIYSEIKKLIGN